MPSRTPFTAKEMHVRGQRIDLWRAQSETHTSESSTGDRCLDRCSMPRRADCDQLTADESSFGEKSRPPRNRSCQEERRGEARERDRGAESESG